MLWYGSDLSDKQCGNVFVGCVINNNTDRAHCTLETRLEIPEIVSTTTGPRKTQGMKH